MKVVALVATVGLAVICDGNKVFLLNGTIVVVGSPLWTSLISTVRGYTEDFLPTNKSSLVAKTPSDLSFVATTKVCANGSIIGTASVVVSSFITSDCVSIISVVEISGVVMFIEVPFWVISKGVLTNVACPLVEINADCVCVFATSISSSLRSPIRNFKLSSLGIRKLAYAVPAASVTNADPSILVLAWLLFAGVI